MKNLYVTTFLDAPVYWQIGFQDPASPIIAGIIHFHNHLIYFLLVIGTFVVWLLIRAWSLFKTSNLENLNNKIPSKFTHSTPLEVIWTILPAILLLLIAGPSFALLYSIDEVVAPNMSLKVIGHQWYWSYEYGDFFNTETGKTVNFDSYIVAEDDLSLGGLRLLEVDNRVKLPINQHIRILVSSADVLHSWAVPSLGIKIDACPGRLNQVSLYLLREGIFYGQCSEICGVNHGFIPIVVESLEKSAYVNWAISHVIVMYKHNYTHGEPKRLYQQWVLHKNKIAGIKSFYKKIKNNHLIWEDVLSSYAKKSRLSGKEEYYKKNLIVLRPAFFNIEDSLRLNISAQYCAIFPLEDRLQLLIGVKIEFNLFRTLLLKYQNKDFEQLLIDKDTAWGRNLSPVFKHIDQEPRTTSKKGVRKEYREAKLYNHNSKDWHSKQPDNIPIKGIKRQVQETEDEATYVTLVKATNKKVYSLVQATEDPNNIKEEKRLKDQRKNLKTHKKHDGTFQSNRLKIIYRNKIQLPADIKPKIKKRRKKILTRYRRHGFIKITYKRRNIFGTISDINGKLYGTVTTGIVTTGTVKNVKGRKRQALYNIRATGQLLIEKILKSKINHYVVSHKGKSFRKKKKTFLRRVLRLKRLRLLQINRPSPRSHNGTRPSKKRRK